MALSSSGAQFREEALRLKAAAPVLMNATRRNIRIAAQPAIAAVREVALSTLPHGGGLNVWVADATLKVATLTGPRTAGVLIRGRKKGHALKAIDEGRVRHRVFGTWRKGVPTQNVPPGYASRTLDKFAPAFTRACFAAMDEAAHEAGFR